MAVVPVLAGNALAGGEGAPIAWLTLLVSLLCALAIQVGTILFNDVSDAVRGNDGLERVGPKRVTIAGLASPGQVKRAASSSFAAALLLGSHRVMVGGWPPEIPTNDHYPKVKPMRTLSKYMCLICSTLPFSSVAGSCEQGWCLECTDPSSGVKEQVVAKNETNFVDACLRVKTYPLFGEKWKTCADADNRELRCVDEVPLFD